jgi:hypothetical protein
VGLGSKDAATRFPGRERSMSRSRHRAGSVGAACSASGEAIAAARWVWLALELSEREGTTRNKGGAGRESCDGCGGKKKRKDGKNPGPWRGRPG